MSEITAGQASREFDNISKTFDLLMGAKRNELETPIYIEIEFPGDEETARERATLVAEEIEAEGYTVTSEHRGSRESDITGSELHQYDLMVEKE